MDSLVTFILGFLGGIFASFIFVVAYKLGRRGKAEHEPEPEAEASTEPVIVPPQGDTMQPMLVRYLDLENDTWDGMRRVALGAAGAGLAISFLVIDIAGARLDVFPWVWAALLVTLLLGLFSYGLRAWASRRAVKAVRLTSTLVAPVPLMPWAIIAERMFITAAGGAVFVAFVLIVVAGEPLV